MKYVSTSGSQSNNLINDDDIERAGDTFMFDLTAGNQGTCNLWRANVGPANPGTQTSVAYAPVLASCYTGRCFLLTGVVQGFRGWQRIGLTVQPRSLIIRGVINAPMSRLQTDAGGNIPADNAHNFLRATYRIVVFRNMEPGNIAPPDPGNDLQVGWHDLFASKTPLGAQTLSGQQIKDGVAWMETSGSGESPFHSVTDFMKTTNGGRFQVVSDTVHTVDSDDPQKNFSLSIPIRGKNLRFGGPQKSNVRAGHYYITACCTTAGGIGGLGDMVAGTAFTVPPLGDYMAMNPAPTRELNPSISFQARLAYTDG